MKIIKYILTGMIVLMASCGKDFVDLSNPNQITTGSFWQTQEDAILGTNAIYQALIYDGTFMRFGPWIRDVRADDTESVTPGYFPEDVANYVVDADNIAYSYPWEHHYVGIWRANQLLDRIEGIEFDDPALKARLIGEAKFLRGHLYFSLLNLFRNVVLFTSDFESADDYYQEQSSPEVVWEQAIQDLTDAVSACWNAGEIRNGYTNDIGRATKGAAAAYLAKALMINQRFDEAAPILKRIIDGEFGNYGLVNDYRDNFTEANENNMESIFEIQYSIGAGGTDQGFTGDPSPSWIKQDGYNKSVAPQPHGWGDVAPSVWIYEEFQKELTVDGDLDPRMEASLYFPHDGDTTYRVYGNTWEHLYDLTWATNDVLPDTFHVFIRKHITEDPELDNAWRSGINRRAFRYADVLLLYAECLNEMGQTATGAPYIQMVRNRASLPDRTLEFAAFTQEQMREQLDHERALELCFEAWRYLDLVRWGWFEDEIKLQILLERDPEYLKYYNPAEGLWLKGREYMAIPPSEIERSNNLIKQNPGWGGA